MAILLHREDAFRIFFFLAFWNIYKTGCFTGERGCYERKTDEAGRYGITVCSGDVADHSHIDVLQRGSEAIRMQMAAEYTWDDVKKAGDKTVKTVSSLPGRINGAVQTVTGKPVLGEPIDEKRHGKQSSVYAVDSGQVVATGEDETIGKYVRISHGKEGESLYGNLEKILVKVPVKVKKGQIIGTYNNSSKKDFYYSFNVVE